MKGILKITIACLVYIPSWAQWSDNFSDGDFILNPEWTGNTSDFIIDTEVLRLNAPAVSSTSYISTASDISLEAQWSFWAKLDFNPSSSNYMKVYLMSDVEDLTAVTNGYFIKIGGTPDEISLYKVVDGVETLLIDGADGRVSLSSVEVAIVVTRDVNGLWEVKSKLLGEVDFVSESTASDLEIQQSSFLGMSCNYTATRSTKMYLDNIDVTGNPYTDQYPPKVLSYETPGATQIRLFFDEPLDPVESQKTVHFLLNGNVQPTQVAQENETTLLLDFEETLNIIDTLDVTSLPDLSANTLDTTFQVLFVDPSPHLAHEIAFNELLPDPNPQEDLPTYEFVELLNLSDRIIDLEGWVFTDGTTVSLLPGQLLFPDSLLILCPDDATDLYKAYGTTIGLSKWPSLNNAGDSLQLIDTNGVVIDSLAYTVDWYKDETKKDGGWSLEQINPFSKCMGMYNWAASTKIGGGTPGGTNTLFTEASDTEPPLITKAILKEDRIEMGFSEPLLPKSYVSTLLPGAFENGFEINSPADSVSFTINQTLNDGVAYTIESELEDCAGNKNRASADLIWVEQPNPQEVIFNEIFPDPTPSVGLPEHEFIEIVNATNKVFDLSGWKLIVNSKEVVLTAQLFYPGSTLLLCATEAEDEYKAFGQTMGLTDWAALTNSGALLELVDEEGSLIDSLTYSTEWYNDGSKAGGGWSLELINPDSKCMGKYNWSASTHASGGTPGTANARFLENEDTSAPIIKGALAENDSIKIWLSEPAVQGAYPATLFPNQTGINFSLKEPANYMVASLPTALNLEQQYTIELALEDCSGNTSNAAASLFPIAAPKPGDLVINELLFNPYTGGSDFVELYNSTPYYINLKDFTLENETTSEHISDSILLVPPHHFLALSEDIVFLKNQYLAPDSSLLFAELPTMPNDEGIVVLKDGEGGTVDSVHYAEEYHFVLLADVEGVSLERILAHEYSNNPDNWKSAAETSGFATPGYANSQSAQPFEEGAVTVAPQVITPNNDGQSDFCQISFELTGSDKVISVSVYNLNGQLVKTLANNVLISPQGFFTWDGTNNQGGTLPTAHYVLISEIIGSDGRTQRFRNKVVVANGF